MCDLVLLRQLGQLQGHRPRGELLQEVQIHAGVDECVVVHEQRIERHEVGLGAARGPELGANLLVEHPRFFCAELLAVYPRLLDVVNEVAPGTVWTEADGVVGPAGGRFVLGVALQVAQLGVTVRELALVRVLTHAALLEGSTQLGLVAGCWFGYAPVQLAVLLVQRHQRGTGATQRRVTVCTNLSLQERRLWLLLLYCCALQK